MLTSHRDPDWLTMMADGTVKQLNPFSGTEVWTVAGRGNRPLGVTLPDPVPIDPAQHGRYCPFCEQRYLETPPEKSRMIRHPDGSRETRYGTTAEELFQSVAEFRRVPNLFEILSYQYWNANYGYTLPSRVAARKAAYLDSAMGRDHVLSVARTKLLAGGRTPEQVDAMTDAEQVDFASGFFGGGHDVIISRRHFVDGATDNTQLAASGIQVAPDPRFVLVNKDVGAQRWTIVKSINTVTGNVFSQDGGAPLFLYCVKQSEQGDDLVLECSGADACSDTACPAFQFIAGRTVFNDFRFSRRRSGFHSFEYCFDPRLDNPRLRLPSRFGFHFSCTWPFAVAELQLARAVFWPFERQNIIQFVFERDRLPLTANRIL